ncbi:MAG: hypothetical protein IJA89_04500 [Clostridia bacterium]|nr:hypothetical protein [Clostridia bacterium]
MRVRIIQPRYSMNAEDLDTCFQDMIALMEDCNEPLDVIVMPEYCDIPSAQKGKQAYRAAIAKFNAPFMQKAVEMAKRCKAITFVNCAYETKDGKLRNTTHAIDRNGNVVGRYYKAHPAPKEDKSESVGGVEMDSSYTHNGQDAYVLTVEGIRFAFMTCYDFYMYEAYPQIARQNVDMIIGCSHQRTDTHQALEIINRFLAYNTNAYLVRASVSLGEDSEIGGGSCIVAPNGEVLVDMKSKVGYQTLDIDISKKYYKAAGFRGALKAHYEYIEEGRRPWLYRNGGRGVVDFEKDMPYPRLCAHRGFNTVAPENSMPAFGAAVSLGAQEIEFDVWETLDGVLVSCHDATLERVSDGNGLIYEKTYEELLKLDFGIKYGESFKGLKIVTFEEILQKFAGRTIMNIHVKTRDFVCEYAETTLRNMLALIDKYDCRRHVYFMCGNDRFHALAQQICPDITRCIGGGDAPLEEVERALKYGCTKIQLVKWAFTPEMIQKAHDNGIRCNIFWSDEVDEANKYFDMGIDCVLTNDYLKIRNACLG